MPLFFNTKKVSPQDPKNLSASEFVKLAEKLEKEADRVGKPRSGKVWSLFRKSKQNPNQEVVDQFNKRLKADPFKFVTSKTNPVGKVYEAGKFEVLMAKKAGLKGIITESKKLDAVAQHALEQLYALGCKRERLLEKSPEIEELEKVWEMDFHNAYEKLKEALPSEQELKADLEVGNTVDKILNGHIAKINEIRNPLEHVMESRGFINERIAGIEREIRSIEKEMQEIAKCELEFPQDSGNSKAVVAKSLDRGAASQVRVNSDKQDPVNTGGKPNDSTSVSFDNIVREKGFLHNGKQYQVVESKAVDGNQPNILDQLESDDRLRNEVPHLNVEGPEGDEVGKTQVYHDIKTINPHIMNNAFNRIMRDAANELGEIRASQVGGEKVLTVDFKQLQTLLGYVLFSNPVDKQGDLKARFGDLINYIHSRVDHNNQAIEIQLEGNRVIMGAKGSKERDKNFQDERVAESLRFARGLLDVIMASGQIQENESTEGVPERW